ncbi:MAG: helix-turn-helix transcriptional regulator [Clostridia bacterium]|nr:helix-turn-helix transcriptional regulator [Clostridia bacterium]
MITLDNIRAKLAEAIKSSELSQSEIARRLGIAHQQVSGYVCGKQMPALDTLANLCVILDLDANEILCVK